MKVILDRAQILEGENVMNLANWIIADLKGYAVDDRQLINKV